VNQIDFFFFIINSTYALLSYTALQICLALQQLVKIFIKVASKIGSFCLVYFIIGLAKSKQKWHNLIYQKVA
jgi:hypothetical protein